MKKYALIVIAALIGGSTYAQCKTFMIGMRGDTLNCTDNKDLKQGKWIVKTPPLRGEPGFEEEGVFKEGKREGIWRRYSTEGDVMAIETYKYGYKNGISQYYNVNGLQRQESWRAVNPEHPYDTVKVYDLKNPDLYELKEVKVEGTAYKQGTWSYYDPSSGRLLKTEEYILDKLQSPLAKAPVVSTDSTGTAAAKPKETKPAAVLDYEKKNQKKKIKVRDGATGY